MDENGRRERGYTVYTKTRVKTNGFLAEKEEEEEEEEELTEREQKQGNAPRRGTLQLDLQSC